MRALQLGQRRARAARVAGLDLRIGDRQHRLGHARVLRRSGDELAQRGDRRRMVAPAVLRVAEPEACAVGVAAARVALQEGAQRAGRRGEVAAAQGRHRALVVALLGRVGEKLAAVDADALRLEAAQALLGGLGGVGLAALQLGEVARELLVAAAQAGQFGAQLLDLGAEVDQAAPQLLLLLQMLLQLLAQRRVGPGGLGQLRAQPLVVGVDLVAQVDDRAARFVVGKQLRLRRHGQREQHRCHRSGHGHGQRHSHHLSGRAARHGGSAPRPARCSRPPPGAPRRS